ncbi:hypothetical protein QM012_004361 [Aureobasidium pullulans]|uniref:Uncharacterized protein n=1 Tax=Aureobasidium pullulans TaxID=5580 RepID=A0ABR0TSZ6_AURPU
MAVKTGPPLLLLLYNLLAAASFGPRLCIYPQLRPSFSLTLQCIVTACLFSTLGFKAIDASLSISRVLYKLLGYLLRRMLDYHLETSVVSQWQLPVSAELGFWIKLLLGIMKGIGAIIYVIEVPAGGWEAAKRNIAASYNVQTQASAKDLGTAERGGVPKEASHGPVYVWAGWAFMYSSALFESKDWFETVIGGKDVQESRGGKWEDMCLYGPMVIAAAVGLAKWRWVKKARRVHLEKEHVGEEASVSEKQ